MRCSQSFKGDHLAALENAFLQSFLPRAKPNDKNKVKSNLPPKEKVKKIEHSDQIGVGGERELLVFSLSQLNVGFPPFRGPKCLPFGSRKVFLWKMGWKSGLRADSSGDCCTLLQHGCSLRKCRAPPSASASPVSCICSAVSGSGMLRARLSHMALSRFPPLPLPPQQGFWKIVLW